MENFVNYVISLKFLSFGPSIPLKSEVFKLYETNLYGCGAARWMGGRVPGYNAHSGPELTYEADFISVKLVSWGEVWQ